MNFKNWFNKKYFKENLKKSKGLLAFFFGIVPLINILVLIISIINNNSRNEILLLDFKSMSIFINLGQYIIPLILAVSLFGFVFKQKSVDFVMSKPLSRNTISRTNIIGGIIVIFLFTLLNAIIYGTAGLFCKGIVAPFGLILDYFIYWFVSYTFIFSICCLAISIAGNIMGTIVVILLLVFMAPFLFLQNAILSSASNRASYYVKCTDSSCIPKNYDCYKNKECIDHLAKNEYRIEASKDYYMTLTAPLVFLNANTDNYTIDTYYTSESVAKMFVLSIVYSALCIYLFRKRKMENNEISFKNSKLHYLIKTLTMFPICFVAYYAVRESGGIGIIIGLVSSIIYYGVYDLITRKELYHPSKSVMICCCTLGILLGFYTIEEIYYKNQDISLKEITELTFDNNITINDKILVNKILQEALDTSPEKRTENFTFTNKGIRYYLDITPETKNEIDSLLTNTKKDYYQKYNFDKIAYLDNSVHVTKELKKLLKEAVSNKDLNKLTSTSSLRFGVYQYTDHHYDIMSLSYGLNPELDKYIMDNKAKQYNAFFDRHYGESLNYDLPNDIISSKDYNLLDYILEKNISQFKNYLETKNNQFDNSAFYLNVYARNEYNRIIICSKKSFQAEINKYLENLKNDSQYQRLLESITSVEDKNEY